MWQTDFGNWLLHSAVFGTVILAVGMIAVRLCRQPGYRIRIIQSTFVACLLVPLLQQIDSIPHSSLVEVKPQTQDTNSRRAESANIASFKVQAIDAAQVVPEAVQSSASIDSQSNTTIPAGKSASSKAFSIPEFLSRMLKSAYLTIVAGWLLMWGIGAIRRRRIVRSSSAAKGTVRDVLESIAGVRTKRIRLLVSGKVDTPVMWGLWRPTIVVPAEFAARPESPELRWGLAHEWSHVIHRDFHSLLLASIVKLVGFYQPTFWWLRRQLLLNQDLIADALAAEHGDSTEDYAAFLVTLAKTHRANPTVAALGIGNRQSNITQRIRALVSTTKPLALRRRFLPATAIVVVTVLTIGGLASIRLNADEAVSGDRKGTTLAAGQQSKSNLPQNIQPQELAGIVIDADGNPIEGVTVDVWSWHKGDETTTDAKGMFRFRPDSDDGRRKVEIRYMKDGYSPHYNPQQAVGVEGLVIKLNRDTFIKGTVTATDGEPAANIVVRAEQRDIQGDGVHISEVSTETTTDANGVYRLYLFPDSYHLSVASDAGVARLPGTKGPADDELEAGQVAGTSGPGIVLEPGMQLRRDIQLDEGVRLEVTVVDTAGKPFEGLVLFSWQQPKYRATSDKDGRLVIDNLLPGEFEFQVGSGVPVEFSGIEFYQHGELGRWWSPDALHKHQQRSVEPDGWQRNFDTLTFDLKPGMPEVKIIVEQGVVFSGHVYDPDGNPVEGATVAPAKTGSGNSLTGDTRYSVATDADGSYRVVMPAGHEFEYNLMVHDGEYGKHRTWGAGVSDPFKSTPGQKFTNFDLKLTRGAIVQGKVTDADEKPVANRHVRSHAADLRGNRYYDATATTKADGTFELKGIRPGKHHIQVEPYWYSGAGPVGTTVLLSLTEGENVENVELRIDPANLESFIPQK